MGVQAEDGIRDGTVTGVQTCALPILVASPRHHIDRQIVARVQLEFGAYRIANREPVPLLSAVERRVLEAGDLGNFEQTSKRLEVVDRSEERRVGKECGWRIWAFKQKTAYEMEL